MDYIIPQDMTEYAFIKNRLKYDYICMDIGANDGFFTKLMAENCKRVYAFEPERNNFMKLAENLKNNTNAILFENAVGNKCEDLTLYKSWVNPGMHRIYESKYYNETAGTQQVRCITIDDILLDSGILDSGLDLIKMDIEGSEWRAIIGMQRTIHKFKPKMIIEFHTPSLLECSYDSPKLIYGFLKDIYGKIALMASDYVHGSKHMDDISYKQLVELTTSQDSLNIYVENPVKK